MSDETDSRAVKVRAIDVVPYHWALWCTVGNGEPFANEIVVVSWSKDQTRLVFMLDTHNFMFRDPDEELSLIPLVPASEEMARFGREQHAKVVAARRREELTHE